MIKLNKTQASKHLKVSRQTIYDLIHKGVLVPDEHGLITFDDDSETTRNECQDTFVECKDSFTDMTEDKRHTVTDVVIGSRRLKNQYILDLKREIERRNRLIDRQTKTLAKQDKYMRLLQAYTAFLEDTIKKYKFDLQPYLKTFFTEYLSAEHLKYFGETLQHIRDNATTIDDEMDMARR